MIHIYRKKLLIVPVESDHVLGAKLAWVSVFDGSGIRRW